MSKLAGKKIIVTGGARGLGRSMVDALVRAGAKVTAVGRDEGSLAQLRTETEGRVETRAGSIVDATFAEKVLRETRPDVVILNAGARPRLASVRDHTWETFSAPWDTDVRGTFVWSQLAMRIPLARGSTVLIGSSGAAIGGSPLSGGYAGAKRMQWILADYLQREANTSQLGLRFHALIPRSIVAGSETGEGAIAAYSQAAGMTREKYLERFGVVVTPAGFARGVVEILTSPPKDSVAYVVLEDRVEAVGTCLSPSEFGALK